MNFLERAQLTKGLAAIYWRSGVGAAIAFAGGKLRRSYSLRYLCGTVRVPCGSLIFNHSKTSPAHGKRQSTCLYISSRWLTLGRHVAHLDERLAQIAFCLFADRRNNPLCGVLMKILLVWPRPAGPRDTRKGQRLLLSDWPCFSHNVNLILCMKLTISF